MYKASMNETLEEAKKVVITSSRRQRLRKEKKKTKVQRFIILRVVNYFKLEQYYRIIKI